MFQYIIHDLLLIVEAVISATQSISTRQLCDTKYRTQLGKSNLKIFGRIANVPCRRSANPLFYSTYFGANMSTRGEGGGVPPVTQNWYDLIMLV